MAETKKPKDLTDHFRVIKMPMVTEKALAPRGPFVRDRKGKITDERRQQYVFHVDRNANKVQIKQAIEAIFEVEVDKVRTIIQKGRTKRVRWRRRPVAPQKKAYVLLKDGHAIDFMS